MDGTSNTLMIGEDVPSLDEWCSWPYANNANYGFRVAKSSPELKLPDLFIAGQANLLGNRSITPEERDHSSGGAAPTITEVALCPATMQAISI